MLVRRLNLVALTGFALAAALVLDSHVDPNSGLDPWSLTVSDFAVSDRGGTADAAMLVMAASALVLLAALRRAGVRLGVWVTALFGVWSAGLLTSALVPTDEPGLPLTVAGSVHRYGSIAAFVALPVAGWIVAGRLPRARGVRGAVLLSAGLALAMLGSFALGDRQLIGLAERLLLAAETLLLVLLALAKPVVARQRLRSPRPDGAGRGAAGQPWCP